MTTLDSRCKRRGTWNMGLAWTKMSRSNGTPLYCSLLPKKNWIVLQKSLLAITHPPKGIRSLCLPSQQRFVRRPSVLSQQEPLSSHDKLPWRNTVCHAFLRSLWCVSITLQRVGTCLVVSSAPYSNKSDVKLAKFNENCYFLQLNAYQPVWNVTCVTTAGLESSK